MLLRELFEGPDADAAFCFGRFNPAHQGHIEVWKAVQGAGHKWFVGTNPSTQGPNDPLRFEDKSAWMEAIYPPIKGHIMPEQSVVTLASRLYKMLGEGKTIAYVTDSNDWAWAGKVLNDYNGKEGPHGYYKFARINHVESPRVSSATALRTAARAGDEAAFYAASGTDPKLTVGGKTYYEAVVAALYANPEKAKKAKKEKAAAEGAPIVVMPRADRLKKPEPTKVRYQGDIVPPSKPPSTEKRGVKGRPGQRPMPDHNLKDSIAELSSELLGKYKKAASADASKADKAGDFKRGDKRFSGIIKATKKQFSNDSKGMK